MLKPGTDMLAELDGSPDLLVVDQLSLSFATALSRVQALDRVSLSVSRGQMAALVGESGSGKSVTSHSILRLLPSTARIDHGRILFEGRDLCAPGVDIRKVRGSGISMIFQHPMTALNPIRPVGKQISDVLRAHLRISRQESAKRALELLDAVRIERAAERFHAYPFELSGGMCQRVMIALAIACEPKLLIADEPTTGLDNTTQKIVMDMVCDLVRGRGMSCLLITHDLGLAARYCERVTVMERGRVVEQGASSELFNAPRDAYTRRLVAATPRVDSRLEDLLPAQERLHIHGGDGVARLYAVEAAEDKAPALLSVRNLRMEYGVSKRKSMLSGFVGSKPAVLAVNGVSFELPRGRCLGIVGESGSGKTTTSRILSRLLDPSSGNVYLDGQDITAIPARDFVRSAMRRRVQYVFQDPSASLNPRFTVQACIVDSLRNLMPDLSRADMIGKAREASALCGLPTQLLGRFPHQLSGGQQARVGIARAIAVRPDLLILDEPTSALDVSVQALVLNQLHQLRHKLGLTYIFISHDLNVVRLMCDDILVLKAGQIVEYGATGKVLSAPEHAYTRELLDATPQLQTKAA